MITIDVSDNIGLFARRTTDIIETLAENAWLEGEDADANPYDIQEETHKHFTWLRKWKECNKYL